MQGAVGVVWCGVVGGEARGARREARGARREARGARCGVRWVGRKMNGHGKDDDEGDAG